MPKPFRSRLLALAFAVSAFVCASVTPGPGGGGPSAYARPGPPRLSFEQQQVEKRHRHARRHARHVRHRKRPLGDRAARIALKAVGVPYRWGGTSPSSGFDCSGLVYWAYGRLGVALPHSSYALAGTGRPVRASRLRRGDLLFFYGNGHVGLYVGHGRMVHAPHAGERVEVVQLAASGYRSALDGARRIR